MASNILLLASKKYFLTSQGLVGAGMNRRALFWQKYWNWLYKTNKKQIWNFNKYLL